ncbi:squalene/phytoene synthase family protein [Palleronia sp. LCG004]|uniref:squalene/phytoene synthase family protein n=1 Tax=Palleronia sp. LCG004 TaxID=3079304 RepID=UPI002942AD32|nr:squalene/phytoene synthase family protein [Palleronia sp. LCG004]WOI57747.1 squalene/phytoene synthase family protein [Palleronia sp. LCG004]
MRRNDAPPAAQGVAMSRGENFPVASLLVRRRSRRLMAAFYDFARAADDVADDPVLPSGEKLARLDRFEAGLDLAPEGEPYGVELARVLIADDRGGATIHARALLGAFRQDAVRTRYASWDDLVDYCRMSADPVGRFILDIHDEAPATYGPSDALCTVLQVLNHMQDLRADYRDLDRVYLPRDMMQAAGCTPADLDRDAASPGLRAAIDATLDLTDGLLAQAALLPGRLTSRRLAGEVRVILVIARRLSARLRAGDPLATRIKPARGDVVRAFAAGIGTALGPRRAGTARVSA